MKTSSTSSTTAQIEHFTLTTEVGITDIDLEAMEDLDCTIKVASDLNNNNVAHTRMTAKSDAGSANKRVVSQQSIHRKNVKPRRRDIERDTAANSTIELLGSLLSTVKEKILKLKIKIMILNVLATTS